MMKHKALTAVAIAAALALTPVAQAQAAQTAPAAVAEAAIRPAACGWKTAYHWDWFQCWVIIGSPPSSCYYRVYSCS